MKRILVFMIAILMIFGLTGTIYAKNTVGIGVGGAFLGEQINFLTSLYYTRALDSKSSVQLQLSYISDFRETNLLISRLTYKHRFLLNEKFGLGVSGGISTFMNQPALFVGGGIDFTLKNRYVFILGVGGSVYLYLGNNLPVEPGIDIDTSFTFKYLISSNFHVSLEYAYMLGKIHSFGAGIQYRF